MSLCFSRVPYENKTASGVAPSSVDSPTGIGIRGWVPRKHSGKTGARRRERRAVGPTAEVGGTRRTRQTWPLPPRVPAQMLSPSQVCRGLAAERESAEGHLPAWDPDGQRVPAQPFLWARPLSTARQGWRGQGPCQGLICCCPLPATSSTHHLLSPPRPSSATFPFPVSY